MCHRQIQAGVGGGGGGTPHLIPSPRPPGVAPSGALWGAWVLALHQQPAGSCSEGVVGGAQGVYVRDRWGRQAVKSVTRPARGQSHAMRFHQHLGLL